MVETIGNHPSWEELWAYGQGRLGAEASLSVEEHLAGCAGCCALLEAAPGDSFLNRLRAVGSTTTSEPGRDANTLSPGPTFGDPAAIPAELIDHPRYRVLGLVGQGGMGAVYRAEHRRMERLVALKVINPGLMRDPGVVQRFHQEVRAAARLHHPNIVHAYDADQAGGLHFLVMEYVEGTTLADLLRQRGPLPVAEACEYVRQAALGLQHAHERGMVHRDIKPHNLMLAADGGLTVLSEQAPAKPQAARQAPDGAVVKILDFGLARLSRAGDGPATDTVPAGPLTGAGAVMGTADYIAPEQAADPRGTDGRADLYSLGCTLFHLLTGRPPFPEGSVSEKLHHHAVTPLPSLAAPRPDVPPGLPAVLARLTAKAPADRYASAAEVAAALAPYCPSGGPPRSRARKRHLLVAAVLLIGAGVLAGALAWRPGRERGQVATPSNENPEPPARDRERRAIVSEDEAVAALEKLGGKIVRDDRADGKPVISVKLDGSRAGDADLRNVAVLKQLRSLDLAGTGPTRMRISDQGLKELAGLERLTWLRIGGPKITDAGLAALARLRELEFLDLSGTLISDDGMRELVRRHPRLLNLNFQAAPRITDAGIKELARLRGLKYLALPGTAITDEGVRALARAPALEVLGLGNTNITDAAVRELARYPRLRFVSLAGDRQVSDEAVAELRKARPNLKVQWPPPPPGPAPAGKITEEQAEATVTGLGGFVGRDDDLPGNPVVVVRLSSGRVNDAALAGLPAFTRLRKLTVSNAGISDEGLTHLKRLGQLRELNLSGCRSLTDRGLAHLARLTGLRSLELGYTAITNAGLAHLAGMKDLRKLSLNTTKVDDGGLAHLQGLTELRELDLFNVGDFGTGKRVTDAGLARLKGLKQLRVLLIPNSRVTGKGLAHLKGMTQMQALNLFCTHVDDDGLAHLEGMTQLQRLVLAGARFTDAGLAHLAGLRKLEDLDISFSKLTDKGLAHLEGLTNLKILNLSQTSITDDGLVHLRPLVRLSNLNLQSTGVGDAGLAHLKANRGLFMLWLSGPKITDVGLAHLKELSRLGVVYLSKTAVTDTGVDELKKALPRVRVSRQ
jgi:Leucine-rich repeat (LRR) protein